MGKTSTAQAPAALRTIPDKIHDVKAPDGKSYLASAPTKAGAIAKVREHLKQEEEWSAEVAESARLLQAGRDNELVIGGPLPVDPAQDPLPLS